ncbi:hypothetical protein HC766_00870 [Candidatus Gracilibacteria bacterium]|nr:hypothetical protein [Candidatus Gracilibacteria bacterium]
MNYANCDMIGHTGDFEASISTLEIIDKQLGRLIEIIEKKIIKCGLLLIMEILKEWVK